MPRTPRTPRIAKAADRADGVASGRSPSSVDPSTRQSAAADADALLALIREHIREGRVVQARTLAAEGAQRYPDHAELKNADRILAGGEAMPHPGTEPGTDEEFEWLRHPPRWARGKWVALVGREAVAVADTLAAVMDSIRSMDLPKKPLVHRVV